eukprot:scaffold54652_cov30-Prasinocladus_malaysianus.AAC.1
MAIQHVVIVTFSIIENARVLLILKWNSGGHALSVRDRHVGSVGQSELKTRTALTCGRSV